MKELLLAIMKNIPEPHIRAAGVAIEALLAMTRHNPSAVTEASVREAIEEVCARVKERAAEEIRATEREIHDTY